MSFPSIYNKPRLLFITDSAVIGAVSALKIFLPREILWLVVALRNSLSFLLNPDSGPVIKVMLSSKFLIDWKSLVASKSKKILKLSWSIADGRSSYIWKSGTIFDPFCSHAWVIIDKAFSLIFDRSFLLMLWSTSVSYTHLTLPTKA